MPSKDTTKENTEAKQDLKEEKTRPITTLFLVNSVDGRITSHDSDEVDPNKQWKKDPRIAALLQPFFDFAQGSIHTLTYAETLVKVGINQRTGKAERLDVDLIVLDEHSLLQKSGLHYLSSHVNHLYLACLHNHPANKLPSSPKNLTLLPFKRKIDLTALLTTLYQDHQVKELTIHSNARYNARWLSEGVIDHLSVIVTPLLVGRHGTPNLIDQDLKEVKRLVIRDINPFGLSFVNLRYDVHNE